MGSEDFSADGETNPIDLGDFVKQSRFFRDQEGPVLTDNGSSKERKQPLPVETVDEQELQFIDSQITRRLIGGKFVGRVVIHGREFAPADHNLSNVQDYHTLPKNESWHKNGSLDFVVNQFSVMLSILMNAYHVDHGSEKRITPKEIDVWNSVVVTHAIDTDNPNLAHIVLNMPDANKDSSLRDVFFTTAYFQCSREILNKLLELGKNNPANWERFVQITFAGLDLVAARRSVSGVTVVDATRILPEEVIAPYKMKRGGGGLMMNDVYGIFRQKDKLDLSAISSHPYPKPLPEFDQNR